MKNIKEIFKGNSLLKTRIKIFFALIFLLNFFFAIEANSQSTREFKNGTDTLIVYSNVPGLAPSAKFAIRVRSAVTNNLWVDVFAHYTYNKALELPDIDQADGSNVTTNTQHYPNFTGGWSQTYGNIEMSKDQAVEVEISAINGFKIDGKDFYKVAIHPAQKASAAIVVGGKIFFTIKNPAQVVIDINGQMDDFNKQIDNNPGYITHTITFFTNPIIKKPAITGSRLKYITPDIDSVEIRAINPSTYDTLCFSPGVHLMGRNFKIYPGKKYYIPGDAIIFGTFNNVGVPLGGYSKIGENIRFYGYGTITGEKITHPLYISISEDHNLYKPIMIDNALNYEVYGVTIIDPANHSCFIPGGVGGAVRWAKVVGWRANSDGFAGNDMVNDCFMRTSDDASYVRGNKTRCTFWKDHFSAVFYMSYIPNKPLLIEDCDVVYLRSRYDDGTSGGLFNDRGSYEGSNLGGIYNTNVIFRNFRVHDSLANMCVFNMKSYKGDNANAPEGVGYSFNGIRFENISIAGTNVKQVLMGCAAAPWYGGVTFDNVSFAGTTLTEQNFSTYFNTNEYVKDLVFTSPIKYTISVNVSGSVGGSVKGGGSFSPGQTAKVIATADPDYIFDKWTEGSTIVSSDSIYIFNVSESRNLTANFILYSGSKYTITTSANLSTSGTVTGDGEYRDGQLIAVSATANSCYKFENWTENSTVVSSDANYIFNVAGNRNLVANFSAKTFTVNVVPPQGGTVTGDLTYGCNQLINVTATPDTDYKFDGWYANNNLISTTLTDAINTGDNLQITAKFSLIYPDNVTELTGWISGTINDKVVGNNRLMVVMVMGEDATSDFSATSITYGGQAMTKKSDRLFYETTYRTYASIFILKENGVNAATSGAIDITWNTTPSVGFSIYSVLLGNVDQTTPVSATADNALAGTSITTTGLAAKSGDMILMCGATSANIDQTFNNDFIKKFESNSSWGDGVGGYKLGSGVSETPKFSQSSSGRMVICAMVVKKFLITGINEVADFKFNIYPNPATDKLFYNSNNTQVDKIELFDLSGRIVFVAKVQNQSGSVDLTGIKSGLYLIKFHTDHSVYSKKVVIK